MCASTHTQWSPLPAAIYEVDGPLLEERVRLPGKYGGLTLRCGGEAEAAAAFWASWATHQCALPGLAESLGWPCTNDPEAGYAQAARACPMTSGVAVDAGALSLTEGASRAYSAGPWQADTPVAESFERG